MLRRLNRSLSKHSDRQRLGRPQSRRPPVATEFELSHNPKVGQCLGRDRVAIVREFTGLGSTRNMEVVTSQAIQKFTILALIFALILLKRHCLGLRLDAAAFPENDPNVPSGKGGTSSSMELAEHPISHVYRHEIRSDPLEPIYPVPTIRLDGPLAPNSDTKEYKGRVHSARSKIARHGRTGPFDLIIDVLDAGAASGRVGDADKRMREAVFDYKQDLTGSLWPVTYTLWLLPTIGFLGTIYGISESLVRAKGLFGSGGVDFGKQIQLVVDGLGVAFDTTSMALICSAILYICQLRTEAMTDSLASHAQASLSTVLIGRMRDRTGPCWPADVDTNPRDSRTPQSD